MNNFSKNLKFLREQKKLSQNKLAELTGVNQTTIARWENEEISPSLDNIYDLSRALVVDIATLTDEDLTNNIKQTSLEQYKILFDKDRKLTDNQKEFILNTISEQHKKFDNENEKID